MIVLLVSVTGVAAYMGRVWMKCWFNPLSLYSAIWGFCLCTYELRLIQYEKISLMAWTYIVIAWVSLYLGAATVLLTQAPTRQRGAPAVHGDLKYLKRAIVFLSVVGAIGVVDQFRVITREFGGVVPVLFSNAGELYLSRSSAELSNIPYVGAFAYGACSLGGVYTAIVGRLTIMVLTPVLLVTVMNIFSMSRLGTAIATVLFVACYVQTPKTTRLKVARSQRILALVLGVIILLGGYVLISATRGLGAEFPGITPEMDRISEYVPIFPAIYSSVSASPVAFSMYLKRPQDQKVEHWGQYTFAPVLRAISKLGFPTYVERLEEHYYTPVDTNISTYLKNLNSDFGFPGVLFFPYFLGMATTVLASRIETGFRLPALVLLSNLYVIVVFSFAFDLMLLGDWYVSVLAGTFVAFLVEQKSRFVSATVGATNGLERNVLGA